MSILFGEGFGDLPVEFDERGLLKKVGTRDVIRDGSGTVVSLQQTSMGVDGLAQWVTGHVNRWENRRDIEYRARWMEYYRLWKGIWAPEDRDRTHERSHAIMPALAQAVDSAVAEMEEATFGREQWFDIEDARSDLDVQLRDLALADLRPSQDAISQIFLLGSIYGTGIGKLVISGDNEGFKQRIVPIEPLQFIPDPAGKTIDEMMGCAHKFMLPKNVITRRQMDGIYAKTDPGQLPDHLNTKDRKSDELGLADTEAVGIVEYHGLVPRAMLPNPPEEEGKMEWQDDEMVEAIVTVANEQTLLKAIANPLQRKDRAFVSYQHFTVPNRFWGMGIMERGYWPQKVLDAEIRSRIDALAFSTHPMMAINAASGLPRSEKFQVRPGRNVFLNGPVDDSNIRPIGFPPPDPQTYTQSAQMERFVEMATGQMQAATPLSTNARNNTSSGMSMMMGASIRRTRKTLANVEKSFLRPLIRKAIWRFQEFDPRYPLIDAEYKVHGTLGIMAREFEQMQLTQMLNALPPGPQSLLIMRAVIDNSSLMEKKEMLQIVDQLLQQAMNPPEPPPDLGAEARMLSAQARVTEVEQTSLIEAKKLELEEVKLQIEQQATQLNHQARVMSISVDADKVDATAARDESQAILNLAKAEAEEQAKSLAQLQAEVEAIKSLPATALSQDFSAIDAVRAELEEIRGQIAQPGEEAESIGPIRVERDADGLVTRVGDRNVLRDENGLIQEVV